MPKFASNTSYTSAQSYTTSQSDTAAQTPHRATQPNELIAPLAFKVQPDDRIDSICYRLFQSLEPINDLIAANPWLIDHLHLPVGRVLNVPERRQNAPKVLKRRPSLSLNSG